MTEGGAGRLDGAIAVGFGTSVAMWLLGYLARFPPAPAPSWAVGVGMLACLLAGGVVLGRAGGAGWREGALAGAIASVVNLLILGSLLGGDAPNQIRPTAVWWLPGSLVLGAALAAVGAAISSRLRPAAAAPHDWRGALPKVAVAATFLLVVAGGLVTSNGAGLAVVDWPNSFGYNMFLYPLSRMTGGVYYEHAHRLFGALVGLTTVALAVQVWRRERRPGVGALALAVVPLVIVQGILGGLRVTGRFTLATSPDAVAPNLALAVVHGTLAQLFLSLLVVLSAFTSASWRAAPPARSDRRAGADRTLTTLLVPVLLVQLVLGALQRHLAAMLMVHIAFAVVVALLALAVGVRALGLYRDLPVLPALGRALIWLVCFQVTLGGLAFVAVTTRVSGVGPTVFEVVARTAHQVNGALLLAGAVLLLVWNRRLLRTDA